MFVWCLSQKLMDRSFIFHLFIFCTCTILQMYTYTRQYSGHVLSTVVSDQAVLVNIMNMDCHDVGSVHAWAYYLPLSTALFLFLKSMNYYNYYFK